MQTMRTLARWLFWIAVVLALAYVSLWLLELWVDKVDA